MIKSVIWSSMLDYPNQIATTLFLGICGWDCEYCHNKSMLGEPSMDFYNEILPKLIKRKPLIDHILISGGECTDYSKIENLVDTLRDSGFTIGIHTNGSNPKVLKNLLPKIDYVGMDIKTLPEYYSSLVHRKVDFGNVLESIEMLIKSNVKYEFRTTLYPLYINTGVCIGIARLLKDLGVKEYVIQQFRNDHMENCEVIPYDESTVRYIENECNNIIKTIVRGV